VGANPARRSSTRNATSCYLLDDSAAPLESPPGGVQRIQTGGAENRVRRFPAQPVAARTPVNEATGDRAVLQPGPSWEREGALNNLVQTGEIFIFF